MACFLSMVGGRGHHLHLDSGLVTATMKKHVQPSPRISNSAEETIYGGNESVRHGIATIVGAAAVGFIVGAARSRNPKVARPALARADSEDPDYVFKQARANSKKGVVSAYARGAASIEPKTIPEGIIGLKRESIKFGGAPTGEKADPTAMNRMKSRLATIICDRIDVNKLKLLRIEAEEYARRVDETRAHDIIDKYLKAKIGDELNHQDEKMELSYTRAKKHVLESEADMWNTTGNYPCDDHIDARQKGAQKWKSILTAEERDSMVKVMIDSHHETSMERQEERSALLDEKRSSFEINNDPKTEQARKDKWNMELKRLRDIRDQRKEHLQTRLKVAYDVGQSLTTFEEPPMAEGEEDED